MNYVYFLTKPPARAIRRPEASFMAKGIGHRYGFLLSVITSLFGRLALSKCGPAPPVALEIKLSAEEKRHEKITLTTVTDDAARALAIGKLPARTHASR